ncbi:MAG: glycosyltransferase family 39 protein [Anaerolineae bacterium]|nr:glycosyltransferase family 39 protein [Anaerolineae bacterium]
MRDKKISRAFWYGMVIIFVLALVPRVIYPVARFMEWYPRSVRFWEALAEGNLEDTYQRYHPGVTTMWIAGFGQRAYALARGWSTQELLAPPDGPLGPQSPPAHAAVVALSLVVSGCIVLIYVLLHRLIGQWAAFAAGFLLALDPFFITHSKIIHLDALMSSFMLLSALLLVSFLRDNKTIWLVASGAFAGLAFLTKSSSGFLAPFTVLLVVLDSLFKERSVLPSSWRGQAWRVIRSLTVWGLVAACVFFLVWPAMWVEPGKILGRIAKSALKHAEEPHDRAAFFAGSLVDDPGPLYYPAVLAWKTTLVTLSGICAAVVLLVRHRREKSSKPLWYLLIYALGFLLAMTLGAKKLARYMVPVLAALDVLAGWGLSRAAAAARRIKWLKKPCWMPTALIAVALVGQGVLVLRHHPYYGTHHNLLLGGSRVAQHVLHMGDQGEGLDLAARFLNSYPGAERMEVGVQNMANLMFGSNFSGRTRPIDRPVDYRVFFINDVQREFLLGLWEDAWATCRQTGPLWTISFDGVPYAWICPNYPYDPQAFAIEHRSSVQLGEHIHLLGYELSSDQVAAGDTLTVILFWQSDGRLVEDDHVFVHLLSMDGDMAAQQDGVPVRSARPTWSWRDAEVLEDEYTLVTDAELLPSTYALSIGMYDYATGVRLPAVTPDGERLPEDRIVLQDIQVMSP